MIPTNCDHNILLFQNVVTIPQVSNSRSESPKRNTSFLEDQGVVITHASLGAFDNTYATALIAGTTLIVCFKPIGNVVLRSF